MKRFTKFVLAGLVIVLVIVAALAVYVYNRLHEDPPILSERIGDLAFMSDRDGTWDVFVLDTNDNLINLTADSEGDEYFFTYTFEGDKLNLYSNASGEFTAAEVYADGSGFRTMSFIEAGLNTLSSGQIDVDPAWSPDGTQIMWTTLRDFNPELYVSNLDGSNPQRLTDDGGSDLMMAWSPDGSQIVYTSDASSKQEVLILDLESGEATKLTDETGWDYQPAWSMDSDQILFVSDREDALLAGSMDIFLVNTDGTGERPFAEDDVFVGDPTYSPDGQQVAYMSNEEGTWNIYVMDADGSNVRRVTDGDANYLFPAWRPIPLEAE